MRQDCLANSIKLKYTIFIIVQEAFMSITKNHQSPETLRRMCAAAFPGREVKSITELTEGMCNAASGPMRRAASAGAGKGTA